MALWRDRLAERQLLLVLDDAVGSDQVLPLLPGSGGSLVLITSRRRLSALNDATAISLDTLPADEAASLLVRLAGRLRLGTGDPGVRQIVRLCGHLPLAIGMVARQLRHHPAWSAARRAAELAAAVDRLELMTTEKVSVAAAFDLSYADLGPDLHYPAAAQALAQALGIYRDLGSRLGKANALNNLGMVRRLTGDYPAAAQAQEQAQGIYRDIGYRNGEAVVLNDRGALHRVSGDLAQAEGWHQQALDVAPHRQFLERGARTGRPGLLRPGWRPRHAGRGPAAAGTGDIPADRRGRGPARARRTRRPHRSATRTVAPAPYRPRSGGHRPAQDWPGAISRLPQRPA
jgi:tetratricopeptide (TPR) repeat protein